MKNKPPAPETIIQKTARLKALRLEAESKIPKSKPKFRPENIYFSNVYTLQSKLPFGKHKGKTIAQVLSQDRNYITWVLTEIKNFVLDDLAQQEYDSLDDPRAPPKAWESPRY